MLLQRGVTGFFNWDERGVVPEFSFREFKELVYGAAAAAQFDVCELAERGITPNFHTALNNCEGRNFAILGHSIYPIIAFAEPLKPMSCQLNFIDCPQITLELVRLFPHVKVAYHADLTQILSDAELSNLDNMEIEQVNYWKPTTVGETMFNWWD
ncbi:MAG: response regulator receiver protein [Schlesneria sp.]|nr:response regulator receiver protein [Schlesneria sp.]